ncbi:MAG: hypothetical protein KIT72_03660 [Polyangiaceae bacterium]|nr:hypothetical protein [Polyangiaceae bacterium]MCW5789498.1 hypothetical protein [Polyangiaceae bacterium]
MLTLRPIFTERLRGAHFSLESGLHVVVGRVEDGLSELAEILAGADPRGQGRVLLDARHPHRDPRARRAIGVLRDHEPPLPRGSLARLVAQRLPTGGVEVARELLGTAGLLERTSQSLSSDERRSLVFLMATCVSRRALVVYEPLSRLPKIAPSTALGRLQAQAAEGAVVIALTANPAHASALGGVTWLLDRGRLTRAPSAPTGALPMDYVVHVSCARRLLAELTEPSIGVQLEPHERHVLTVSGADPQATSLLILSAVQRAGVELYGLHPRTPTVDQLRAVAAARATAAYHAETRAALSHYDATQGNMQRHDAMRGAHSEHGATQGAHLEHGATHGTRAARGVTREDPS